MENAILFYLIGGFIIFAALRVLLDANPIKCALGLVLAMIGVSGIFFLLNASFLAAVQLAIYAGAVMVLFVMVLMLFDLKKEVQAFSNGILATSLKVASAAVVLILLVKQLFTQPVVSAVNKLSDEAMSTKYLAALLFTDYIWVFELLGLMLLAIAIGAVALSRIKGGTHAE